MTDSRELRVGNYLQGKPLSIPRMGIYSNGITSMTAYGIYCIDNGILTTMEAIPLTSDILSNIPHFGKTDKDGVPMYFNGDNLMIRIEDMSLFMHSELDGSVFWVCYLKSLHHLQNIYYSIEGHDLSYTP